MSQILKKRIISLLLIFTVAGFVFAGTIMANEAEIAYLTVENTTFLESDGAPWDGKLLDNVAIEIVSGEDKIVDVIVRGLEAVGYSQVGADMGYISEIHGLAEFGSGGSGGWMITLNDWFTSSGVTEFYVSDGDHIRVMYSTEGFGEDLGSTWGDNNKNLAGIEFSEGVLSSEFDAETYEYTLTIPAETVSIKVNPVAANKNFQTRIYLNTEFSDGECGKFIEGEEEYENILCGLSPWSDVPESIGFYKRTQSIPVKDGDVIAVACGLPYWSSMNNGEWGSGAEEIAGHVYTFVVKEEEAEIEIAEISVDVGIYDYTAVTYKENNPESDFAVSETGIIFETAGFIVQEGTTVLDGLLSALEGSEYTVNLNESGNYIVSVGGLSETDCGSESGWMISVNDEFLSIAANEAILKDGDHIKLHYSVSGWGTDIGNYFSGSPVVKKFVLEEVETVISSNTVYEDENDWTGTTTYYLGEYIEGGNNTELEGDGTEENPFIIPVKVSSSVDISALTAKLETSLHNKYLYLGEGEGLSNILEVTSYEDDVKFAIETPGGIFKTYYTVKVSEIPVYVPSSSGGSRRNPVKQETEEKEQEKAEEKEEKTAEEKEEKTESSIKEIKFNDIKGHWAENYMTALCEKGIIEGKSKDSFAPDDKIKRGEVVTLLYRLGGNQKTDTELQFNDVKEEDWYYEAIMWAVEKGITNGVSQSSFCPQEFVTREQLAVLIMRFASAEEYKLEEGKTEAEFSDKENISVWARDAVEKASRLKIVNGYEDGKFLPGENATRAQVAKMLCTLLDSQQ